MGSENCECSVLEKCVAVFCLGLFSRKPRREISCNDTRQGDTVKWIGLLDFLVCPFPIGL